MNIIDEHNEVIRWQLEEAIKDGDMSYAPTYNEILKALDLSRDRIKLLVSQIDEITNA